MAYAISFAEAAIIICGHINYSMRTLILVFIMIAVFAGHLRAQHFSLYNTGTLYDSFENPSQSSFQTDSSRQYAFNFLIPTVGFNSSVTGPAVPTVKTALYNQKYDTNELSVTDDEFSKAAVNENTYLFTFKLFKSVKYHRELGLSWQVKTEAYGEASNQTLIVFQDYRRIVDERQNNQGFDNNLFKTNLYAQSFHQFSITYRENYNKRLAYGVKLSYLSGIAYSKALITSSNLDADPETGNYTVYADGDFRTTFYYDDFHRKMLLPGLKNPGLALGLSANYKSKQGWYFMGNVKDIGFIRWSKNSYVFKNPNFSMQASTLGDSLWKEVKKDLKQKSYTTAINGKAEFLLNKDLGNYQPNLILSKNIFYRGGDIALINTYRYKSLNLSLSTAYNLNNFFAIGTQVMFKSPNAEFFLGSDQILKTLQVKTSLVNSDATLGSGYSGASAYFGFALKFGRIMSRRENENYIPGINFKTDKKKPGFFERIFGKRD